MDAKRPQRALTRLSGSIAIAIFGMTSLFDRTPPTRPTPLTPPTLAAATHPASRSARTVGASAVTVFGAAGTLAGIPTLPTGQSLQTVAVPGWAFRPGKQAGWAATTGGKVFMGGGDLGGGPLAPTGTEEVLSVFDPATLGLSHILVKTTSGSSSVVGSNGLTGGAPMPDPEVVRVGKQDQVVAISSGPYHGWRISGPDGHGLFPAFVVFRKQGGAWIVDPARSKTVDQLRDSSPAGAAAFPNLVNGYGETYANGLSFSDVAATPASRVAIAATYFNDPSAPNRGGRIVAIDPKTGIVLASYVHPYASTYPGELSIAPRNVLMDPTGTIGDERFVLVYDAFSAPGVGATFNVIQEFRYDHLTRSITPTSPPFRPDASGAKWGQGVFDQEGNLWVTLQGPAPFMPGATTVYAKTVGTHSYTTGGCALGANWWIDQFGQVCEPDFRLDPPAGAQMPWGRMREDPVTKTVFWVSLNGRIMSYARTGSGLGMQITERPTIDLGWGSVLLGVTGKLVPSDGVVDATNRVAWLPVAQLQSTGTCPSPPCAPYQLAQWLYRLDLGQVF